MIRYECPRCARRLFDADGLLNVRVMTKCSRCREKVTPIASGGGPVVRSYRCTKCSREQTCVDPVDRTTFCVVCGTTTLVITAEHRPESAPSAKPETHGALANG